MYKLVRTFFRYYIKQIIALQDFDMNTFEDGNEIITVEAYSDDKSNTRSDPVTEFRTYIKPLTWSMKWFGLHFENKAEHEAKGKRTLSCKKFSLQQIYCMAVVAMQWMNLVRLFCTINMNEPLGMA